MRDIRFCGRSLEELGDLPAVAKREAGYQLDRVQHGLEPTNWKPMPSIGSVVREIRIMHEGQYRVIYVTKFADAVYVLHAFQKKTQKTRKQDIDTAKQALKQLQNEA
ncbi:MAG: type II toxin-antitoxin system RelE/ParE family toxin [Gammaproteobacteria bacterium]|nr:type II toxin-antitoxin system RelE/ParE family toxin [Gammaproteobacteria bacterium]